MWKQAITLILLPAFIAGHFSHSVMLLDYFARTSSYSGKCVNKARPAMHCNGKCQLMKKMQQQSQQEQEQSGNSMKKFDFISRHSFPDADSFTVIRNRPFNVDQFSLFPSIFIASVFRPPILLFNEQSV